MRKLAVKEWNEFGDAVVELVKITPPDEVEAKAKWEKERPQRQARRVRIIAERG